jgi:superfamily II DNA or RNA helicase
VRVEIGTHLRLIVSDVPETMLDVVLDELTVENTGRERAESEMVRGAGEMDQWVPLWRRDGRHVVLPRGYAHRLERVAQDLCVDVEWVDAMTSVPRARRVLRDWPAAELYEHQVEARDAILTWASGFVCVPTGGGKTRTFLEAARWAGQRTIVVVNKTSLARQWQGTIKDVYGYDCGFIGEGEWDERDFTVAIWQSLHRTLTVDDPFFARWGMLGVDEGHRAASEALSELIQRFPAYYRVGLSATPRWDAESWAVVSNVIGPVISEVGEVAMKPTIRMVQTGLQGEYVGTHMDGRKRVQNNYSELLDVLSSDDERNRQVVEIAVTEASAGHAVIVHTGRIEHVRRLVALLVARGMTERVNLHVLTGKQTGRQAERIKALVEGCETGSVLVSTVVNEGFDLPVADRLVLAFPIRKTPLVEQIVGRVLRSSPGKSDAVVFDLIDSQIGVFKSQARTRTRLYYERGWTVLNHEQQEVA